MALISIQVQDVVIRMTAKAMLEAAGHQITPGPAAVTVTDDPQAAGRLAQEGPVLLLTVASEVEAAVRAMQQGVYGYVLLPFVPGELALMAQRATQQTVVVAEAPAAEPLTLEARELQHIQETLRRCRHNQAEAARQLGIGRNTLWRKLKRLRAQVEGAQLSAQP
jgi:DNA-binding NtrC family response regulator